MKTNDGVVRVYINPKSPAKRLLEGLFKEVFKGRNVKRVSREEMEKRSLRQKTIGVGR